MRRFQPSLRGPGARRQGLAGATLLLLLLVGGATTLRGQEAQAPDTLTGGFAVRVSPRGAFIRSALVPGWGHASIGSFNRGAFYVTAQGATVYTLIKTWRRLMEMEDRIDFREGILRADLAAEGVTDPEVVEARLGEDEELERLRSLEASRRQQREDWLALGIFLMLLSGADAYVSAHLSDFPVPIQLEAQGAGGSRAEFFVRIPLPN